MVPLSSFDVWPVSHLSSAVSASDQSIQITPIMQIAYNAVSSNVLTAHSIDLMKSYLARGLALLVSGKLTDLNDANPDYDGTTIIDEPCEFDSSF